MARLLVNSRARADVERIASHIAKDHVRAAIGFILAAKAAFERLAEIPGLGPEWEPRIAKYPDLRFWPITRYRNYLVLYRPIAGGVRILRVMHGARDVNRVLGPQT
jgi:toxin ParE1/3/4